MENVSLANFQTTEYWKALQKKGVFIRNGLENVKYVQV